MAQAKTADYYKAKGAAAHEAGIVRIPVSAPRGWQQTAERAGYALAKQQWLAANPGASWLDAMTEKNRAFCMRAIKR